MPLSVVEQIKDKLDVVSLIGSYIKVEKTGANFKARCPFHSEKTPSFFISPTRGSYYCFGCNAKGDIFSFVEKFEGLDFKGALKVLAARTGVELLPERPEVRSERDRMYLILEESCSFFEWALEGEAKEYLLKRGLKEKTIKEWRIGWAPVEWRKLKEYLASKGFSEVEMERAGLVKRSDGNAYDRFRGRIIFPIADSSGRVVAFTGRILHDDGKSAKYLNSPETELFNKSKILFGFEKAKNAIRLKDYSILVEGQMDLIMSHQAGVVNSIASSGTAFTVDHLNLLKRLSNRIILAFDSDKAGVAASGRSTALALSLGMEVKLAPLVGGKDPADLILQDPKLWSDALKGAKHAVDFYLDLALADKAEGRELVKELRAKVLPYVSVIESSMEKSHYVSLIASRTGISESSIMEDLKKVKSPLENLEADRIAEPIKEKDNADRKDSILRRVMAIYFWQSSLQDKSIEIKDVESKVEEIGKVDFNKLVDKFETSKEELIFEAENYHGNSNKLKIDLEELIAEYERECLKDEFAKIMASLTKAEHKKDSEEQEKLTTRAHEIMQYLKKSKGPSS